PEIDEVRGLPALPIHDLDGELEAVAGPGGGGPVGAEGVEELQEPELEGGAFAQVGGRPALGEGVEAPGGGFDGWEGHVLQRWGRRWRAEGGVGSTLPAARSAPRVTWARAEVLAKLPVWLNLRNGAQHTEISESKWAMPLEDCGLVRKLNAG